MPEPSDPIDDKELSALHARAPCGSGRNLIDGNIDLGLYYSAVAENHFWGAQQKIIL